MYKRCGLPHSSACFDRERLFFCTTLQSKLCWRHAAFLELMILDRIAQIYMWTAHAFTAAMWLYRLRERSR